MQGTYWIVRALGDFVAPVSLYDDYPSRLFLDSTGQLCNLSTMAMLDNEFLAKRLLGYGFSKLTPIYGKYLELKILPVSTRINRWTADRIGIDTVQAKKTLGLL